MLTGHVVVRCLPTLSGGATMLCRASNRRSFPWQLICVKWCTRSLQPARQVRGGTAAGRPRGRGFRQRHHHRPFCWRHGFGEWA